MSPDWRPLVQPYASPSNARSLWQVTTTIAGLVATEAAATWAWGAVPWLALPLVVVAGLLCVRVFVLQHDCGHGSFLTHARLQDAIGTALGFVVWTPYEAWRRAHAMHHATTGDLDRRGSGDVDTLTVDEYRRLGRWSRFRYRAYRAPLILFGVGAVLYFLVGHRLPSLFGATLDARARRSVHVTNVGVPAVFALVFAAGGWQALLLVHLPAMAIACSLGVFLFYLQHQIEHPSWTRRAEWSFATASLEGSSHLQLPRVLRYFTADIGVHHLHHLAPRIPNYKLQRCVDENPALQARTTLTMWSALSTMKLRLYDEETGRMVGFAAAANQAGSSAHASTTNDASGRVGAFS